MPRSVHATDTPKTADERVSPLALTIEQLAHAVGQAVALALATREHAPSRASRIKAGHRTNATGAPEETLSGRIATVAQRTLEQSLCARTARGRSLRLGLIAGLAQAEIDGSLVARTAIAADKSQTLSTAQAAARLKVSRPYVTMLCDAGKLGQVVVTEGGHRRIQASAVEAYLAKRTRQHQGALSPREAGAAAGLYEVPDEQYANEGGHNARAAERARPAKTPRKLTP